MKLQHFYVALNLNFTNFFTVVCFEILDHVEPEWIRSLEKALKKPKVGTRDVGRVAAQLSVSLATIKVQFFIPLTLKRILVHTIENLDRFIRHELIQISSLKPIFQN